MPVQDEIETTIQKVDDLIDRLALEFSDAELQMLATRIAALFDHEVIPERLFAVRGRRPGSSTSPYHTACYEAAAELAEVWTGFHEANPAHSKKRVPMSVTKEFTDRAIQESDAIQSALKSKPDLDAFTTMYDRARLLIQPYRDQQSFRK